MSWMQPRGRSGRNVRAWGQSWHIVWITNLSTGFLPRSWRCLAYSTGDFMWRIFLLLTSTGQQVSISGDSGQKLIHLSADTCLSVSRTSRPWSRVEALSWLTASEVSPGRPPVSSPTSSSTSPWRWTRWLSVSRQVLYISFRRCRRSDKGDKSTRMKDLSVNWNPSSQARGNLNK